MRVETHSLGHQSPVTVLPLQIEHPLLYLERSRLQSSNPICIWEFLKSFYKRQVNRRCGMPGNRGSLMFANSRLWRSALTTCKLISADVTWEHSGYSSPRPDVTFPDWKTHLFYIAGQGMLKDELQQDWQVAYFNWSDSFQCHVRHLHLHKQYVSFKGLLPSCKQLYPCNKCEPPINSYLPVGLLATAMSQRLQAQGQGKYYHLHKGLGVYAALSARQGPHSVR